MEILSMQWLPELNKGQMERKRNQLGFYGFLFVIQSPLNTFHSMYFDAESTCLFMTVSLWIIKTQVLFCTFVYTLQWPAFHFLVGLIWPSPEEEQKLLSHIPMMPIPVGTESSTRTSLLWKPVLLWRCSSWQLWSWGKNEFRHLCHLKCIQHWST